MSANYKPFPTLTPGEFFKVSAAEAARINKHCADMAGEIQRLTHALRVPEKWTEAERDGMAQAFINAHERHGHYEALFAVAAWLLRHRSESAPNNGTEASL